MKFLFIAFALGVTYITAKPSYFSEEQIDKMADDILKDMEDKMRNIKPSPRPAKVCPECPRIADSFHCGTDGVTYTSKCFMNEIICLSDGKVQKDYDGKCKQADMVKKDSSIDPKACDRHCPLKMEPAFCASDGVTYISKCLKDKIACQTKVEIYIVHEGECKMKHYPKKPAVKKEDNGKPDRCFRDCPINAVAEMYECGEDGVTYTSKCFFDQAECYKGGEIKITPGMCKK